MSVSSQTNRPTVHLHPEERIIREGAPLPGLFWSNTVGSAIVLLLAVVTAPLILFVPAVVRRRIGWHRWWITNQRLVVRTGFIGWRVQSVPLDRIVDVTIQSSWWDRMFGLEHIKVRDMTGEVSGNGVSHALHLLAVPDAHEVAEVLHTASPRVASSPGEMSEVVKLLKVLVAKPC
jgi:uncharacterized membrane protein YdbT with pleckstrin-like domain